MFFYYIKKAKTYSRYLILSALPLLLIGESAFQQRHNKLLFTSNPTLSSKEGIPKDSAIYYFPVTAFMDTTTRIAYNNTGKVQKTYSPALEEYSKLKNIDKRKLMDTSYIRIDSFKLEWYSKVLRLMKEPLLYNYYLGREVYRFTWLRSFHPPVSISLIKNGKQIIICTKTLQSNPVFGIQIDLQGKVIKDERYKNIPLKLNTTKTVNIKQWQTFNQLLQKYNFWYMPSTQNRLGIDGSEWILESHQPDGYYFVNRWSPNRKREESFRELCEYLVNLSDAAKELEY